MDSMETKKKLTTILIHVILIIVSITMLVPFIWMILTAFHHFPENMEKRRIYFCYQ